jgi:hypothetical protein
LTRSRGKKGSGRWGCRPLVGMGDGGTEIRDSYAGPELIVILLGLAARVDRPKGSISPGTFVPRIRFEGRSLFPAGLPGATRGDTLGLVTEFQRGLRVVREARSYCLNSPI